ncbi:MAG: PAS domain S-box protein [Deltaproteobacteria bacterium]|nr:PAS domain S-box protein [Deltaproteobacteria bacterium]
MSEKPTYEELEKRVGQLEDDLARQGEALEELKRFVERSQDVIYRFDLAARRFVLYNQAAYELYGAKDGTRPTAKTVLATIHPDDRDDVRRAAEESVTLNRTGGEVDYRQVRADGSVRWMHDRWNVVREESGRAISIEGIVRDNTERKQVEMELHRLAEAVRQASEAIVITKTDGKIEYANPAFEKITGYPLDELIGLNPRVLKSGHHDEAFYKNLWNTILQGRQWTGRIINKRKDGTLYTAECFVSPVKNEAGDIVNFVWITRDITKELELEKRLSQAQRIESIGVLAGGIAHDFNNLLFPIIGRCEMLLEDIPSNEPNHTNVEQIYRAAKRAEDLVKQILSFSRRTDHKMAPVRIQQALREALKLARSTIPSNIEIFQQIQDDCDVVMADPSQLHQIAMNLITNAYHAVEATGGTISIRLKELALTGGDLEGTSLGPGKYAVISVSDTGYGIDPAVMGRIFEPYFTTKEREKGTGLGLSVVYGIAKEYGGDIRVYSEVGKGSTFVVYLPILSDISTAVATDKAVTFETGRERILVVDDEVLIARLEKQMLERLGYHVEERTGSLEALKAFKADPDAFDLVITDMTMPNMTGDRLARELLSIKPGIPIIICTGFSEKLSEEGAKAIGIKGFLMKPMGRKDLALMVRKVLDEAYGT